MGTGRFCPERQFRNRLREVRVAHPNPTAQTYVAKLTRPILLLVFFADLDAERLEKLHILIADLEFGIAAEGGDQGSLVRGVLALFADADGSFENQENVVAAFLDAGNDLGDRFGIG